MPSPVTPNDIKNTLPNVDSGVCDRLKKVIIDFPRKVYAWMSYVYNDDGTFTEEFKQELCSIKCDDLKGGPVGPINGPLDPTGGTLTKIVSLVATPGTSHLGGISLIFKHDPAATYYSAYRTPTITVAHATPGTQYAANATNINVKALVEEIAKGEKIYFDNGTVLTVTGDTAIEDATAIPCTLSGVLPDKTEGHLGPSSATLLVKEQGFHENVGWQQQKSGFFIKRGEDVLFRDEHGSRIWDGSSYITQKSDGSTANVLDGGRRYNYWVVSKSSSGDYSTYSNKGVGFSKYVGNFDTEDANTGLIYSGGDDSRYEENVLSSLTYPNSNVSYMRVVLRGGGGAGGAGGDYLQPTVLDHHVKTLTYTDSSTPISFTLGGSSTPDITHWSVGDEVKLVDNGTSAYNVSYIISEVVQGNQFKVNAVDMSGNSSTQNGTIPNTSDASYGRVYRVNDKQKIAITGGGGGAGGLLIAVFKIKDEITKVRVRTIDSSNPSGTPNTVNYSDEGTAPVRQDAFSLADSGDDMWATYNKGGVGRISSSVDATAGEPHASDATSNIIDGTTYSKTSLTAPYFTLFEVYSSTDSAWHEVARVADGTGGGYRDGFTNLVSTGGKGGKTYSTTNFSAECVLKTDALTALPGVVLNSGQFFRKGGDGTAGVTVKYPGPTANGSPGLGAYVWDGLKPTGPMTPNALRAQGGHTTTLPGMAFDLYAPGSGASGSKGSSDEADAPWCAGAHAIAGCAWVTYSDTAYDLY